MPALGPGSDDSRRRRTHLGFGCWVGVLVALGGCSEPSPPPTPEPSAADESIVLPLAEIECEQGRDPAGTRAREIQGPAGQRNPAPPDGEKVPERRPLPVDFEPVAAVLCVEVTQNETGTVTYAQWLADVEIEGLVDILRMGDETAPAAACDNYYDPQPNLWLVGKDGGVVAPRWPLDGCNHLRAPAPEVAIPDSSLIEPAAGAPTPVEP